MMHLKRLAAFFAVAAVIALSGLSLIDWKPIPIYDNAGNSIESIFAGVAPSEDAEWLLAIDRDQPRLLQEHHKHKQESAALAYLDRMLGVETAHAQDEDDEIDCSGDYRECSGHYMYPDWWECQWSCPIDYVKLESAPQYSIWEMGWAIWGIETVCCGTKCKESDCWNGFGDDEEDYQDQ